jgi:maleylpyruvate isomerase
MLSAIHDATASLVRSVDGLDDAALAAPSLLPGWSRAHVVAHLTTNAEALSGVLHGLAAGEPVSMYRSKESRDADIAERAEVPPHVLRDQFLGSCTLIWEALQHTPDAAWAGTFSRMPGQPPLSAASIPAMRHREVEIHHVDLGVDYTRASWPEEFVDAVFNTVVKDRMTGLSMRLRTPDGDVIIGDGDGPTVTGSREDLTWWLIGRGSGEGLTAEPGLPTLPPWR